MPVAARLSVFSACRFAAFFIADSDPLAVDAREQGRPVRRGICRPLRFPVFPTRIANGRALAARRPAALAFCVPFAIHFSTPSLLSAHDARIFSADHHKGAGKVLDNFFIL